MARSDRSRYFTLAHQYVSVAIYNGDLPRLDGSIACVDCGKPAKEYDHRDYKKPMEVSPVCRSCNEARGPGLHRDPSETAVKPPTIAQRRDIGNLRVIREAASARRVSFLERYEAGESMADMARKESVSRARISYMIQLARKEAASVADIPEPPK